MRAFRITEDRCEWKNEGVTLTPFDTENTAAIDRVLAEWVLCVSYKVTYEDESESSDLRYKELFPDSLVFAGDTPVGVRLRQTHYTFNSSCLSYTYFVLFFEKPKEGDGWREDVLREGVRHGSHYVEGYAFYSLERRAELHPNTKVDTAGTQFIPVPDVI